MVDHIIQHTATPTIRSKIKATQGVIMAGNSIVKHTSFVGTLDEIVGRNIFCILWCLKVYDLSRSPEVMYQMPPHLKIFSEYGEVIYNILLWS